MTPRRLALPLLLALPAAAHPPQEPTVSDLYLPGETASWHFTLGGEDLGACSSTYEGTVDLAGTRAHVFRARALLRHAAGGRNIEQRMTADLWTDGGGHPLRVDFRSAAGEASAGVQIVFAGDEAEATIHQGPRPQSRTLEVEPGAWVLANNVLSHLELALALRAPGPGESVELPMVSVNVLQGLTVRVEHVETRASEDGGTIHVLRDSLGEVLHLDERGRLVRVELPAQDVVIERTGAELEPFAIDLPGPRAERDDLDAEPVTIVHGDVSLAGTITRPKGAAGVLPAVFFISGSGLQDRDGFSGGIDVGTHQILDRLSAEGFLVLRVDDRGAGESVGSTEGATYDDLVEDARRCVQFLRERADVDAARIALIGHSEGGMTAPLLAAEMPSVAAIALMAAPGRPIQELVREQLLYAAELEGLGPQQREEQGRVIDEFFRRVGAGEPPPDGLPAGLAMLVPSLPWIESHLRQDPLSTIRKVRCPVLVLQGARDIQVSVERDARVLAAALREAGNADVELAVFDELDHLFMRTAGETSSGLDYLRDRPVDPEFLDVLVEWLRARLGPR